MKAETITAIRREVASHQLPDDFMRTVFDAYLPVANEIARRQQHKETPLMVSFNGAQGSGKSTITAFLCLLLKSEFQLSVCDVSIDDFYLTRAQRQDLAQQIHPLLKTRGVPGTHDIPLAKKTLSKLLNRQNANEVLIPIFNKAADDRHDRSQWKKSSQLFDVVLFEGWCNHAPVETDQQRLAQAINDLELEHDPQAVWRTYVNCALEYYHKELFSMADMLVFLSIPSFEKVFEWRSLQEQKLAASSNYQSKIMDEKALKHFIQHYERITRRCLEQLPSQADIVIKLKHDHSVEQVILA